MSKTHSVTYRAYKAAWAQRRATGSDSVQLLRESFAKAGVPRKFQDQSRPEGRFWFEAWRDGIRPRRLRRRLLTEGIRPYFKAFEIIWNAARGADRVPRARRIPNRYETVGFDGWQFGEVALVTVASFEPNDRAADIVSGALPKDSAEKKYRKLPVWLSVPAGPEPVKVMSGKHAIGRIGHDPEYVPLLRELNARREDIVADGTILARRDGDSVKFKKLKVHVLVRLKAPTSA